jgi:hypothetical protein
MEEEETGVVRDEYSTAMGTARRERSQVYVSPGRFKKKIQMS